MSDNAAQRKISHQAKEMFILVKEIFLCGIYSKFIPTRREKGRNRF